MENKQPLVSVVMNCYNSDTYLKEAIESVLAQTYTNWEIIFWDNQSTDNSAQIVKSYDDKKIRYFYAPSFTPLGKARNLAIDKCNGEWVGFLDCDDLWDKDKLKLSFIGLEHSDNIENISLIYSKSYIINKNNDIISKNEKSPSGYIHDDLLINGNFTIFSSIIVRKEILNKYSNIDETLNYCEDYDLLLKISKNYAVIGINKFLTSYRMHDVNITSSKIYENNIEVVKLLELYTKNNNFSFKLRYNIWINNSYRVGTLLIKLLWGKEFKNSIELISDYLYYLIVFPFSVLLVKLF